MPDYIITNVSTLKSEAKEWDYETECGMIKGTQTNDAPVKTLLRLIADQNPDEAATILAVVTDPAAEAYERFKDVISQYAADETIPLPAFEKIDADEAQFAPAVQAIVRLIPKNADVYIDTTGGFRNSSYLLTVVVRILEYSGISFKKAVYSNFHADPKKVIDVTGNYHLFNLINAANSFTSFGNAVELAAFFREKGTPEIRRVIDAMNAFSDAVALCRTSKLDTILRNLNDSLHAMQSAEANDEASILFESISGTIRSKFGIEDPEKELGYPEIIRWCLDNQMIQQAVTIYTEKIPEYLFQKQYISVSTDLMQEIDARKGFNDLYYAMLYSDQKSFMNLIPSCAELPIVRYLKRYQDDKEFKEAMRQADRLQTLIRSNKDYRDGINTDVEKGMISVFTLLNMLFDRKGNRIPDVTGPIYSSDHKNLFPIAQRNKSTTRERFINQLMQLTPKDCQLLQGNYTCRNKIYENAHLNNIAYIDDVIRESVGFEVHVPADCMQPILLDYYFIKNFLRNAFNHASDERERTEEENAFFSQHGYPTEQEPPLETVIRIITQALQNLNHKQ